MSRRRRVHAPRRRTTLDGLSYYEWERRIISYIERGLAARRERLIVVDSIRSEIAERASHPAERASQ